MKKAGLTERESVLGKLGTDPLACWTGVEVSMVPPSPSVNACLFKLTVVD